MRIVTVLPSKRHSALPAEMSDWTMLAAADATVPVRASIFHQRQFHGRNDREQLDARSRKAAFA